MFKSIRKFISSTIQELRSMEWLSSTEVATSTLLVIGLTTLVTITIVSMDAVLVYIRTFLFENTVI